MSIVGRMLTKRSVLDAVVETLSGWLPYYLQRMEEQEGLPLGALGEVKAIVRYDELERLPEDALPCVHVEGDVENIAAQGDGGYVYTYKISVVATVSGVDFADTEWKRDAYVAALRTILVQQGDLGGLASGTTLVEELQPQTGLDTERTLGSSGIAVNVVVEDVVTAGAGPTGGPPATPSDPPADWPVVETHDEVVQTMES